MGDGDSVLVVVLTRGLTFAFSNPLLQSEKIDPQGEYIRKWVPEIAEVKDNKRIHNQYGRGFCEASRQEWISRAMVDHKESRDRALTRYIRTR